MKTHEIAIFENSQTVKRQVMTYNKVIGNIGIKVEVRWDDRCGNGKNSFSITGDMGEKRKGNYKHDVFYIGDDRFIYTCGGCIHDKIGKYFPELKHLIKYHLMNANAPTYFFENAQYHAKEGNLKSAQKCAFWDSASLDDILDDAKMLDHLAKIMPEFKTEVLKLGMVW